MGKHVLSSDISSTAAQPFVKKTHEWYNSMITEAINALGRSLVTSNTDFTVLFGCVNSGTGLAPGDSANISAGAVFYNGEIYLCDAFSAVSLTNTVVGTITTTYATGDPILFTDGSSYNVHQDKKIVWSDAASGSGDVDFADLVTLSISSGYVNITSGLTFKYVDDGGTLRTIVASPTLTNFKYRLIGKTCHLQIEISNIDTSTSNSGVGHSEIQILGLPAAITPKTGSAYSVLGSKSSGGATLASDFLFGKINSTTLYAQTLNGTNTATSATNTRLYGEFTYEVN